MKWDYYTVMFYPQFDFFYVYLRSPKRSLEQKLLFLYCFLLLWGGLSPSEDLTVILLSVVLLYYYYYFPWWLSRNFQPMKSINEQKLLRIMLSIYEVFIFFSNDPFREFWVRSLKIAFQYISKTIKNFWTFTEQIMFEISRPLIWFQAKEAGRLN